MSSHLQSLKSDTHRLYGRFSLGLLLQGLLSRRTFRPIVSLRLCHAADARARWLLPACKLLHRVLAHLAGMDLPWRTQIGPGFTITHGWGLVINEGTRIGKNVTLFHGVTLGRRDRIATDGQRNTTFPKLEDEVWVGPNAIIVGGITIGRGSRIAGGAYVVHDIPAYSVVSGNPATIVKSGCVPDVMNPSP